MALFDSQFERQPLYLLRNSPLKLNLSPERESGGPGGLRGHQIYRFNAVYLDRSDLAENERLGRELRSDCVVINRQRAGKSRNCLEGEETALGGGEDVIVVPDSGYVLMF